MDALLAAADDIGGLQAGQVFEPEAGALGFAMAELPRLDALGKFAVIDDPRLRVLVHHRIFDADAFDRRVPEGGEEIAGLVELAPYLLQRLARRRDREPSHTGIAKPRAGRVRDHEQVPAIVQMIAGIAADVAV
jgi:hypothetical protein